MKVWGGKMEISRMLKEKRKEKQWTQIQLAEAIFVSKKTISNSENERTVPDIESLIRIAKLFDLSLDELLLEDSTLVNEMKKKEKIADLTKIYWVGPIATGIFLLMLMYLPLEIDSIWSLLIIGLASCTNLASFSYLKMNLYSLNGKEDKVKNELKHSRIFLFVFVLCFSLFIVFLYLL